MVLPVRRKKASEEFACLLIRQNGLGMVTVWYPVICCCLIGRASKTVSYSVRGGVMNIVKQRTLSSNEAAFEMDMRNLLREKNSKTSNHEGEQARIEVSALVSRISGQSIQEIDHLVEGLQGLRRKLDDEGGRLERDIRSYAAFSQSVVDLANIVSEGMAVIRSANSISGTDDAASRS